MDDATATAPAHTLGITIERGPVHFFAYVRRAEDTPAWVVFVRAVRVEAREGAVFAGTESGVARGSIRSTHR